jgi:DNA mismatch repair protein MutL
VRDRTLNHAILSAYDSLLPKGKFPVVVLFLQVDADLVDVNVHPTKREVRFRQPGEILETVRRAIRGAMERPIVTPGHTHNASTLTPSRSWMGERFTGTLLSREDQGTFRREPHPDPPCRADSPPTQLKAYAGLHPTFSQPDPLIPLEILQKEALDFTEEPQLSRCRPIGQLMNTFILLESDDGMILVDQHAAHERILFNEISAKSHHEAAQRLVQSVVFELMPLQAATLRRWLPQLAELGFEIESFGGDSFVIHTVPAALNRMAPDLILRDLAEKTPEEETAPRIDLYTQLAQSAACHDAIKAGRKLHPEELRRLLEDLDAAHIASTCPHGRPVWIKITSKEIARMFQRT